MKFWDEANGFILEGDISIYFLHAYRRLGAKGSYLPL